MRYLATIELDKLVIKTIKLYKAIKTRYIDHSLCCVSIVSVSIRVVRSITSNFGTTYTRDKMWHDPWPFKLQFAMIWYVFSVRQTKFVERRVSTYLLFCESKFLCEEYWKTIRTYVRGFVFMPDGTSVIKLKWWRVGWRVEGTWVPGRKKNHAIIEPLRNSDLCTTIEYVCLSRV